MTDHDRDRYILETHAAVVAVADRVSDHHRTLYGNGQAGVLSEFRSLQTEHRHRTCEAAMDIRHRRSLWIAILGTLSACALDIILRLLGVGTGC